MRIIGISGSLRRHSFNTALLRAAAAVAPGDLDVKIASIADIPLYNYDVEVSQGLPEAVTRLKEAIVAADGLLLVTPEYNNSLPGVLKNAVDWLTRPPKDIPRVFGGLPVAIIGASAGGFGTILSQNAWLPVLRTLRARFFSGGRLMVSRAQGVFNENDELVDDELRERLRAFMNEFALFVRDTGARAT